MKKSLIYILIHFLSAVIADWITVEHDYNMCDQVVDSKYASFHIDDDGITYSTSLLIRDVQTIRHEPPLTSLNITMWGCTYDCKFSFFVNINRNNLTVSSYTEKDQNNYKCNLSNYTMKLIPTPKITYKQKTPNPDHVFPTELTAQYCKEGKHPDAPDFPIDQTENIAECIDYLTGNEVGTYAASLQFGSGSSFNPDYYPVATYHMINSANKLFNYWERHHRGFHDALQELSFKMTPDNLKELIPPPPPPPKTNLLAMIIIPISAAIILIALPTVAYYFGAAMFSEFVATTSEIAAEIGAAEEVVASSAEGSIASVEAEAWIGEAVEDVDNVGIFEDYEDVLEDNAMFRMASYFDRIENEDFDDYLLDFYDNPIIEKRDTVPNKFGFFTANMMNIIFLPSLMNNLHQSFTGNGQDYPDISSYLSAASEHLQFHFDDALHNNFFTANKSILASFTVNKMTYNKKMLDNEDDVYNSIKNSTYNTMAASIISATLRKFNVEICDPKPSFCGLPCGNSGHIYCPIVGNSTNSCVISATDNQVNELKFLRDPFDICLKANSTGWNITYNSNCDRKQFQCK